MDNDPDFQSGALDGSARGHGAQFQFIFPAKPSATALVKPFDSRPRDERFSPRRVFTLPGSRRTIERWRVGYNTARPHRGLKHLIPAQFAAQYPQDTMTGLSA